MKSIKYILITTILGLLVSCAGTPRDLAPGDWAESEATLITEDQDTTPQGFVIPSWVSAFQWSGFTFEPQGEIYKISNDNTFRLVRKLEKRAWTFEGKKYYLQNLIYKAPRSPNPAEGTIKVVMSDISKGDSSLLINDIQMAGLRSLSRSSGWIRIAKIVATAEGLNVELEYR